MPYRPAHRFTIPTRALAACAGWILATAVHAQSIAPDPQQTLRLIAVEDFPVLDAGEVPYYRDLSRDALAIDAAQVAYRERPARAEHRFEGDAGRYDLTLETLGEIDGEGRFSVWVDGVSLGDVFNAATDDDFAPQRFAFEDIAIANGSVIAVESTATSNNTIPEDGAFAYARGRWRALELTRRDSVADDTVMNLRLAAPDSLSLADSSTALTLLVSNDAGSTEVATGLRVTLAPPTGITVASAACGVGAQPDRWICPLSELAPGASQALSMTLVHDAPIDDGAELQARLDADQAASDDSTTAVAIRLITPGADTDAAPDTDTATGVVKTGSGGAPSPRWLASLVALLGWRRRAERVATVAR